MPQKASIKKTLKENTKMLLIARLKINPIMQIITHTMQMFSIKFPMSFFYWLILCLFLMVQSKYFFLIYANKNNMFYNIVVQHGIFVVYLCTYVPIYRLVKYLYTI